MNAKDIAKIHKHGPGLYWITLRDPPAIMISRIDWTADIGTLDQFLSSSIPAFQIDAIGLHETRLISPEKIIEIEPLDPRLNALRSRTNGPDDTNPSNTQEKTQNTAAPAPGRVAAFTAPGAASGENRPRKRPV